MSNKSLAVSSLPTSYPAVDLETVYKRLLKVNDFILKGAKVDRVTLRGSLGFGSDNGRSNSIISSLMHFGLLYRDETSYFITDLARDLMSSEDDKEKWSEYALKAAISPKLFGQLYVRFRTKLPDDIKTKLMMGYRIKSSRVEEVIKNYQKSLEFGGTESLLDDQVETKGLAGSSTTRNDEIFDELPPTPPEELIAFPFPLSNKTIVTLNLPPRLVMNDARRISRFIETLVIQGGQEDGQA